MVDSRVVVLNVVKMSRPAMTLMAAGILWFELKGPMLVLLESRKTAVFAVAVLFCVRQLLVVR